MAPARAGIRATRRDFADITMPVPLPQHSYCKSPTRLMEGLFRKRAGLRMSLHHSDRSRYRCRASWR